MNSLDIVIPAYNESDSIVVVANSVLEAFGRIPEISFRLIVVNDGSSDGTDRMLDDLAGKDTRVQVVHLWGNHGHQKALIAGLDASDADLVLMMDGDGQHPVNTALAMVKVLMERSDLDVVQGIRRGNQEGTFKNKSSSAFYWLANNLLGEKSIQTGASDFRVIRRSVVDLIKRYPDRHRNLRILLASLRLPADHITYELGNRLAGSSRYNLKKMMALAADGCFAFSSIPLRLSLLLMMVSGALLLVYLVYVVAVFLAGKTVPGWTSIIALVSVMFTAVFGVLAILSEYIARIYEDVRRHPVYKIRPKS